MHEQAKTQTTSPAPPTAMPYSLNALAAAAPALPTLWLVFLTPRPTPTSRLSALLLAGLPLALRTPNVPLPLPLFVLLSLLIFSCASCVVQFSTSRARSSSPVALYRVDVVVVVVYERARRFSLLSGERELVRRESIRSSHSSSVSLVTGSWFWRCDRISTTSVSGLPVSFSIPKVADAARA